MLQSSQPREPGRSKKSRSQTVILLNFLMTLLFFGVLATGAVLYIGKILFEQKGPLLQTTRFVVSDGAGLGTIAYKLAEANIVSNAFIFRHASASILGKDSLKTGEYEIKAGASMREIMQLMRSGKSILYSFTIPEGLTVYQIFERLKASEILIGALPETLPSEGSLLPETYKFPRNTTRQQLIDQMIVAQNRVVDSLWEQRAPDLPIKTKEELLILASIVEKETGKADERAHVASVFINRLRKNMRLQSDPTIIYGIFGGKGKPSARPIYQSDIKAKNDYNTYQIDRLPPTPIANPGFKAIEAVINPADTDDLFFVADGMGGHAFAKTLKDHNINVARWRRIEAEKRKATQAANSSSN